MTHPQVNSERNLYRYLGYAGVFGLAIGAEAKEPETFIGTFLATAIILSIIYELWVLLLSRVWGPFVKLPRIAKFMNIESRGGLVFSGQFAIAVGIPVSLLRLITLAFEQLPYIGKLVWPVWKIFFSD